MAGMVQNRSLARALADAGFGDLGRLLAYKAGWYGCRLTVADRWYPSSKTCSGCGQIKPDLTLADRTYRCAACGLVLDRDVNAAVNLAIWPARLEVDGRLFPVPDGCDATCSRQAATGVGGAREMPRTDSVALRASSVSCHCRAVP